MPILSPTARPFLDRSEDDRTGFEHVWYTHKVSNAIQVIAGLIFEFVTFGFRSIGDMQFPGLPPLVGRRRGGPSFEGEGRAHIRQCDKTFLLRPNG